MSSARRKRGSESAETRRGGVESVRSYEIVVVDFYKV